MGTSYEKRLLRAIEFIHANPAGDLSLDHLADIAAMSRFHWHRVFHAMTGETAAEAVRRIRLHRSACLLVETDMAVAAVAAQVGYPNGRSFARTFADAYGLSPQAFRKRGVVNLALPVKTKGDDKMFDVVIRTDPDRHLAATSHKGSYQAIGSAFDRLSAILSARGYWPQVRGMVGIYYDDPAAVAVADLRSKAAAELVPGAAVPDGLDAITLMGGRIAVLLFKGPYAGLPAAYDHLYRVWLPAAQVELRDTAPYEIYLNSPMNTAPDDLLTEICLPLA